MSQFKNHYQYILIIKNTVKFHTPRKIGVFGTESCLLLLLFICKPGKKKKKVTLEDFDDRNLEMFAIIGRLNTSRRTSSILHNQHSRLSVSQRPTVLMRLNTKAAGVESTSVLHRQSESRKPPPIKRATRAVLTKEQATEVYRQKLNNEASSSLAGARVTANAATIARRLGTHHSPLQKTLLHIFPMSRWFIRPL